MTYILERIVKKMNGYTLLADSYRQLKQNGTIDAAEADKAIRIYDFLASCDAEDKRLLFDSSAFNDMILYVCKQAIADAGVSQSAAAKILAAVQSRFD
jgi:hypothetical protein